MSQTPHTKHIITPPILLHIPSTTLLRTLLSEALHRILRPPFVLRFRTQRVVLCAGEVQVPWYAVVKAGLALARFAFHDGRGGVGVELAGGAAGEGAVPVVGMIAFGGAAGYYFETGKGMK